MITALIVANIVLLLIIAFLCYLVVLHARHNAIIEQVNGERIDIATAQYYEIEKLRYENRELRKAEDERRGQDSASQPA